MGLEKQEVDRTGQEEDRGGFYLFGSTLLLLFIMTSGLSDV